MTTSERDNQILRIINRLEDDERIPLEFTCDIVRRALGEATNKIKGDEVTSD